ncbi:hypothetical protein NFJ02_07g131910 [Pycnococcus provasolii]
MAPWPMVAPHANHAANQRNVVDRLIHWLLATGGLIFGVVCAYHSLLWNLFLVASGVVTSMLRASTAAWVSHLVSWAKCILYVSRRYSTDAATSALRVAFACLQSIADFIPFYHQQEA